MEWIKDSPKVELHVHLDGAFCTDILWRLAKYTPLSPGRMPPLLQPCASLALQRSLSPPISFHMPALWFLLGGGVTLLQL